MSDPLKVLIVSDHASALFGGEAALPLHYFRVLKKLGHEVWLVVHARTRPELSQLYPGDPRILYVEDTKFHLLMWHLSKPLPARISAGVLGFVTRLVTQRAQRHIVRRLIRDEGVQVVHQPMPVSPREPSLMHGLGVPVVMGPMNGDIDFPPGFNQYESRLVSAVVFAGRAAYGVLNRLIPGKLRAAALLVANARTGRALPKGAKGKVIEVVENGVDLDLWASRTVEDESAEAGAVPRFLFMGRLVDWKAVDLLLAAFKTASQRAPMALTIVGDGAERPMLEEMARANSLWAEAEGAEGKVFFAGWKSQKECADILNRSSVLVLSSLRECGGAVVLEAMAAGRPAIATDWGGPADYLDPSCGILVKPSTRALFVEGLVEALVRMAQSRDSRVAMGRAAREKAMRDFDWDVKGRQVVAIYRDLIRSGSAT
jgi:glycosyltransferase involved in cell wall biosynthesis